MKVVINISYGAITDATQARRFDPDFIEAVETGRFSGNTSVRLGYAETLKVVEIPDTATDYQLVEYDGCEGVIYVDGGKIHYVGSDEFRERCIKNG